MNRTARPLVLMVCTLFLGAAASAEKLELPPGMGGVPDIGAIPCAVFNQMIIIGPLGTRQSLLTWAEGYFHAKSGKTIDEILEDARASGKSWDFDRLTGHFVAYCAVNPEAMTMAAVTDLGEQLLSAPPQQR